MGTFAWYGNFNSLPFPHIYVQIIHKENFYHLNSTCFTSFMPVINRCVHALACMWWPRTGTDGVYVRRFECSAPFNQIIIHRRLWSSVLALHLCSWRSVAFTLGKKNNIKLHKHPAVEARSAPQQLSATGRLSSETLNKCTFFFFFNP